MKLMTALAVFALSTGLAWGAAESEKKEISPAQQENAATSKTAVKSEKKVSKKEVKEKKAPSPEQIKQREKMKTCNAEAGKQELKGDERKKFLSICLKKDK
ncbi:hypothetical protein AGMMS50256_00380 [Betaproteobacteria bacterium]|nr:hypothetical protein AGMMS50256_00380 [Betaproteobacteria bacterium]